MTPRRFFTERDSTRKAEMYTRLLVGVLAITAPMQARTLDDQDPKKPLVVKAAAQDVQVKLEVPEDVDEHDLILVKATPANGKFYDLSVLTVIKGDIRYIRTIQTLNPGEFVFTGPPGEYTLRLLVAIGDRFKTATASVRIKPVDGDDDGGGGGGGDDGDDDMVAVDNFDNVGRLIDKVIGEKCSDDFPRLGMAEIYTRASEKLKDGISAGAAMRFIKEEQDKLYGDTDRWADCWQLHVTPEVAKAWGKHVKGSTNKAVAADFFKAVAAGLRARIKR